MKLLTNEQQKSYKHAKISYICKDNLKINIGNIGNTIK